MEITHVIRSQEFLASVPRFLNLYEALEIDQPILATMPYVMGPDGKKKLSKRDGAKDVLDYAREGYLPEAMLNFMATLGWNDGTEQEIFSVDELIKKFSLDRVQHSGAAFDDHRLQWMNGAHIRALSPESLASRAKDFWPSEAASAQDDYKNQILGLVQERLKFFAEIPELTRFFFVEPSAEATKKLVDEPQDKQLQKADHATFKPLLEKAATTLSESDFSEADIQNRLNGLLESEQTKPGILFALVRIAVTGSTQSPAIFGTLRVLGRETSLARLHQTINLL